MPCHADAAYAGLGWQTPCRPLRAACETAFSCGTVPHALRADGGGGGVSERVGDRVYFSPSRVVAVSADFLPLLMLPSPSLFCTLKPVNGRVKLSGSSCVTDRANCRLQATCCTRPDLSVSLPRKGLVMARETNRPLVYSGGRPFLRQLSFLGSPFHAAPVRVSLTSCLSWHVSGIPPPPPQPCGTAKGVGYEYTFKTRPDPDRMARS